MADTSFAVDAAYLLASRNVPINGTAVLTPGVTLFTGWLPSDPDNCVKISDTSGVQGVYTMGPAESDPKIEYLSIQVIVRHLVYAEAWALTCRIHNVFRNFQGDMNGTPYELVRERYSPMFIGRDENNRSQFSLNYTAMRRP